MGSLFDLLDLPPAERQGAARRSPPALVHDRDAPKRKAGHRDGDAPLPRPPADLDWLTGLIGPAMTLRLIELYGGSRVFVPMRAGASQKLARELSPVAEAALVEVFGGGNIRVPVAKEWRAQVYRAMGETVGAIAVRLVCDERSVRDYLAVRNRPRQAPDQFRGRAPADTPAPAGMPGQRRPR